MSFKEDWAEWVWRMRHLEDCPESEITELMNHIKEVWNDSEAKEYWINRVREEADFSRELKKKGEKLEERMKNGH